MHELRQMFTSPNAVIQLESDALAAKLLFLFKEPSSCSGPGSGGLLLTNLFSSLWESMQEEEWRAWPWNRRSEIELAISEAWAWLCAQGLLVPAPGNQANESWRVLSRKASQFVDARQFADFSIARLLNPEILHAELYSKVWSAFISNDFDYAVFSAFKVVEIAVRKAAKLPDDVIGVKLMRKAFGSPAGVLTDKHAEEGEKDARMNLFAGAIGSYKNPQSHRDVNLTNSAEAVELVLLANHLLRIVDVRKAALSNADNI